MSQVNDTTPPAHALLTEAQRALLSQRLRGESARNATLGPRPAGGAARLSFQQERIWIQERLAPNTAAQNIAQVIRIDGPLSHLSLQRALDNLMARHDNLRTQFVVVGQHPQQQVVDDMRVTIDRIDLRQTPTELKNEQLSKHLHEAASKPFSDLSRGPLMRARLVRKHAAEHYLALTIHHILADGWSFGLLRSELMQCYKALSAGDEPDLPALQVQYADYAHWQRSQMSPDQAKLHAEYWQRSLAGAPQHLEFPSDQPRPVKASSRAGTIERHIPAEALSALQQLATAEGASMFMATMAVFQQLIRQHTGQSDFLIGVPFAGRNHVEIERLIGCFINPMAVRTDLDRVTTFRQHLKAVRARVLGMFAHQEYPFSKVVEQVCDDRDSTTPLFQVMLTWQGSYPANSASTGPTWTVLPADSGSTQLDLTLLMDERPDGVRATLIFRTDLFSHGFCETVLDRFVHLLRWLGRHPDAVLASSELLRPTELEWLLRLSAGQPPSSADADNVADLFYCQATRSPEATAVVCEYQHVSYRELAGQARRLARQLLARGVEPGDRVGIALSRGADIAAVMLGTMTAGAVCVLIDPDLPRARLDMILRDSGARCLLVDVPFSAATDVCSSLRLPLLDRYDRRDADLSDGVLPTLANADSLAYIIYTSGSTGMPKGVMVDHRALCNQLAWRIDTCHLAPGDAVLHTIPFYFDPSLWQLFGPLLAGANVVIADEQDCRDPHRISRLIMQRSISIVDFVPSMLSAYLASTPRDSLTGVRIIFCGGEVLGRGLLDAVQARTDAVVFNQYGPTETAIDATSWRSDRDSVHGTVPIGRPIHGKRVYVCDSELRLVPQGVFGEICIGGIGVARGYLDDPAKTAMCFLPDPYAIAEGARLYRTGDRGRVLSDGQIDYAGRIDSQVKVRGHRVELDEIAAHLNSHPAVDSAKVLLNVQGVLNAHVVLRAGWKASQDALIVLLSERLPKYMVPAAVFFHDAFPLTANGKVDEKRLADLLPTQRNCRHAGEANGLEVAVEIAWRKALGIDAVGLDDNFFSLGGNSLAAIHLAADLRTACAVEVPVTAVFEHPTVCRLAAFVASLHARDNAIPALRRREDIDPCQPHDLTWRQRLVWRWIQTGRFESLHQSLIALTLQGQLDVPALQQAVDLVVQRHHSLRTRFHGDLEHGLQSALPVRSGVLEVFRASELGDIRPVDWVAQQWRTRLAYSQGQVFRAAVLQLREDESVLYIGLHKLIDDGTANGIAVDEILRAYDALSGGRIVALEPVPLQQCDYAAWEAAYLTGPMITNMLSHYDLLLGSARPLTWKGKTSVDQAPAHCITRRFILDESTSQALRNHARSTGATPFILLMAAWQLMLARWTGEEHFLVGVPLHCRDEPALRKAVVRTVNMSVIPADFRGQRSFEDVVKSVTASMRQAQQLRHTPYVLIADELTRRFKKMAPVSSVFNYLTPRNMAWEAGRLQISHFEHGIQREAEHDLYLIASETETTTTCQLLARDGLFGQPEMDQIVSLFHEVVRHAMSQTASPIGL